MIKNNGACDLECEECGNHKTNYSAYDDRNYWDNVIPAQKCNACGKSTNDVKSTIKQKIPTKYPEGLQV